MRKSPGLRRLTFKLKTSVSRISFFKIICVFLIALVFFLLINIYNNSYKPQIKNISEQKANYILNNAVNNGINEVILKNELLYDDMVTLMSDNEGKVSALMTNLVTMNRLKSEFTLNINEKINDLTETTIEIPLGNLTKIDTLSGLGPKLKVKLVPSGRVAIDFKNSFSEAGINQTKHEIYLEVISTASVLMPTGIYSKTEVKSKIPLCESIIVGKVPESLTRLETRDETLRDDILNIY